MANQPYYTNLDWKQHAPLKYRTGGEAIDSVVLASNNVTANSDGQKLVAAGELVCKITSGTYIGKYGPYLKTATDGTQTLTLGSIGFTMEGHDIALGDEPAAIVYGFATFDKSELTMNGASLHGTTYTALVAAFHSCEFMD